MSLRHKQTPGSTMLAEHGFNAAIIERFNALPAPSPASRLALRVGSLADYAQLASYHYLRHAPVTATRVMALDDPTPPISARFAGGAVDARPSVVAVLVESYPALSCVLRDQATDGRYAGWHDRRAAARVINTEVRCISRVVVHPQWRGLGLAVRLVRHALDTATTPITEALAAMGRVHPFFELAGMTAYRRWPHAKDQRLLDALAASGVETWRLASVERMRDTVESTPLLRRELRRWAGAALPLDDQLRRARDRLLCEPVYYLHMKRTE